MNLYTSLDYYRFISGAVPWPDTKMGKRKADSGKEGESSSEQEPRHEENNEALGEMVKLMADMSRRMTQMEENVKKVMEPSNGTETAGGPVEPANGRSLGDVLAATNALPSVLEEDQASDIRGECGALIDDHLTAETRTKIQQGQYVELSSLLLGYGGVAGSAKKDEEKEKDRKTEGPMSHSKWQAAFNVYMSCYLEVHVEEARYLIKYSDNIQKMHDMKADWAGYDRRFRAHRAMVPNAYPWWKICSDLFLTSMVAKNTDNKINRDSDKGKGVCFDFNDNACGRGVSCAYQHKCRDCGSYKHGRISCPERAKHPRANNRHNSSYSRSPYHRSSYQSTYSGQGRPAKRGNEGGSGRR